MIILTRLNGQRLVLNRDVVVVALVRDFRASVLARAGELQLVPLFGHAESRNPPSLKQIASNLLQE